MQVYKSGKGIEKKWGEKKRQMEMEWVWDRELKNEIEKERKVPNTEMELVRESNRTNGLNNTWSLTYDAVTQLCLQATRTSMCNVSACNE